jgi:hypothetical protein
MSPYQAVAVAVRLFAAWLAIYVLRTVISFALVRQSDVPGFGVAVAFVVLTAVLVGVLWFFPGSIARKLLSPENAKAESGASPDLWLAMGCALLGLWMLTSTLPSLVLDTYALVYIDVASDNSELKRSVLYLLVQIAIALWLLLGAKGFRRFFWWARNAGYKKTL